MLRSPIVPLLEVNLGRFLGRLRRAKLPVRSQTLLARAAKEELRKVLRRTVDDVRDDYRRSGSAGNFMRFQGIRVTGTTLRAIKGTIRGPSYIRLQEEGGSITPKNSSALAIPIFDGLRPDGTAKLPSPRSWQNIKKTFVYKSRKTGKSYIAYADNDGRLKILYVLLAKVDFKARGLLQKAWNSHKSELSRAVGAVFRAEISKVNLLKKARITTRGRRR